jgi:hypothetical protein
MYLYKLVQDALFLHYYFLNSIKLEYILSKAIRISSLVFAPVMTTLPVTKISNTTRNIIYEMRGMYSKEVSTFQPHS